MVQNNKKKNFIYVGTVFIILILLNIISKNIFKRWDFTDNQIYSLSDSSQSIVSKIEDRLILKIYFSDDLPGEYGNNRRYLQDILEEYAAYSKGNIHFEFYQPESNEAMQEDAQKYGIQPVQLQVIENDKLEVKRVYMGMVFIYGDMRETIPLIEQTTGLEYNISTKIKKLVDNNKKTIAIAKTVNQENLKNENISQILGQRYSIRNLNFNQEIPSEVKLVLMNGVEDSISENEKLNLEKYINEGGHLLLAQNRVSWDLQTQQATQIESNIFSLLDSYGLHIEPNLVLDLNCGQIQVQQNLGLFRIPVPMNYPFLPIIKKTNFNSNIEIVNGLEGLRMIFPSQVNINDSLNKVIPLFTSSNKSTSMQEFFNLNPDPDANPSFKKLNEEGKILGAMAEIPNKESSSLSKIILISDSKFISDDGGSDLNATENHIFIENAVDYLLGDKELLSLRSREITNRPLEELDDDEKSRWKWANILLPSLLAISLGFFRLKKENNRTKYLEEIYES